MFDEHYEEIHRREAAADDIHTRQQQDPASACDARFAPRKDSSSYELADQTHLVYSVSHVGVPPLSTTGHGSVRLYGAFDSAEEAGEWGSKISQHDPGISVLVSPMRKWLPIPSTVDRLMDTNVMAEVRQSILDDYNAQLEDDHFDFAGRLAARDTPNVQDVQGEPLKTIESLEDAPRDDEEGAADCSAKRIGTTAKKTSSTLPMGLRPDHQNWAVLSALYPEGNEHGEFLVKVHGFFGTDDMAGRWAQEVASKENRSWTLDIVSSGSWVCPHHMTGHTAPSETFTEPELGVIMDRHRTEPSRVKQFKDELAAQDAAKVAGLDVATASTSAMRRPDRV